MKIKSLRQIENIFNHHGVNEIFCKVLSLKQDNEKNQIYLGGTNGISNLFHYSLKEGSISKSTKKSQSSPGRKIVYADLNFNWLDNQSNLYKAPNAKNIIYFQYAKSGEVRFSGFLKGCQASLDCLRRDKQHLFGQRLLIFGFNNNGENFGLILNERDDPIISDFPSLPNAQFSSMIQTHSFGPSMTENMNMNMNMNLVESFYFSH